MSKRQVAIGLRALWFNVVERWYDLANVALPIFLVTGLIVLCGRFWLWVAGIGF